MNNIIQTDSCYIHKGWYWYLWRRFLPKKSQELPKLAESSALAIAIFGYIFLLLIFSLLITINSTHRVIPINYYLLSQAISYLQQARLYIVTLTWIMYYSESLSDEYLNHNYRGKISSLRSCGCGCCFGELFDRRHNHDRDLMETILDIFPCCATPTSHLELYSVV